MVSCVVSGERVVRAKLKLHDAKACGVCAVSERGYVRPKLKLHEAEALWCLAVGGQLLGRN